MSESTSGQMAHLFDAELRYHGGMAPVRDVADGWQLAGSGTGHVEGPRMSGVVHWSNFELVFEDHCRLNVMGTIETVDGQNTAGADFRFVGPRCQGI